MGEAPKKITITDDARNLLREFVPDWSEEAIESSESIEAAMSKLEAYALRFSLIFRLLREVQGQAGPDDEITREDLENGIELARWFKGEAIRAYGQIAEDDEDHQRILDARAEIIRTKFGGAVTKRDWQKRNTRRTTEQAQAELNELVEARMAYWRERQPGSRGGTPTRECAVQESGAEVVGCGLRGAGTADASDIDEAPPDGPEGGDPGDEACEAEGVQPGTSLRDGAPARPVVHRSDDLPDGSEPEACNPEPLSNDEEKEAHPSPTPSPGGIPGRDVQDELGNPQPATHNLPTGDRLDAFTEHVCEVFDGKVVDDDSGGSDSREVA